MNQLPKNWKRTTLGQILDYGSAEKVDPSTLDEGEWILELEDIEKDTSTLLQRVTLRERVSKSTKSRFEPNDVLYGKLRPTLNKIIIADVPGVCTTEIIPLRAPNGVEPRYLFYALKRPEFLDYVASVSHGLDMPRLGTQAGKDAPFPLAPHPEQGRIVAKLARLSACSSGARHELDRIPTLTERYKHAILAAAFDGRLTADFRKAIKDKAPVNRLSIDSPYTQNFVAPPSWQQSTVSGICTIAGGSQPPKSTFKYDPLPRYVRLIQIRDYKGDKHATFIPATAARKTCSASDVMIGRYGPPIFQILRGIEGAYNVALMKASPTPLVSNEFLYWRLQDPRLKSYVEMGSDRTAGQDGVNKAHLLKYPIFVPPPGEQEKILRRIQIALSWADKVAAEYARAAHLLPKLDQTILAKAFRGELVPQDPNDEPAAKLLERMRAERAERPQRTARAERRKFVGGRANHRT
jgi:type I restriction enzyme S subunit